jgi:hypothetical protein
MENVILKLNSTEVWDRLTIFQQALWVIDETEAQWQRIIKSYPTLEYINVMWSKDVPSSFGQALAKIGSLIQLSPRNHTIDSNPVDGSIRNVRNSRLGIMRRKSRKYYKQAYQHALQVLEVKNSHTGNAKLNDYKSRWNEYNDADQSYRLIMSSQSSYVNITQYIY